MANINQVITLGIGTPSGIPDFLLFGLQTAPDPNSISVADSITVLDVASASFLTTHLIGVTETVTIIDVVTGMAILGSAPIIRVYAIDGENRVYAIDGETRTYPISG